MRVVCFHVQAGTRDSYAPIDMARGVIDKPTRNRPGIVPEYLSRLCIKSEGIVRPGEVHDAIHNYRRRLQNAGSLGMKDPLRLQVGNILGSDLGKTAEAPARVVAI